MSKRRKTRRRAKLDRKPWKKGYSQAQLDAAQERFQLKFPPDLIDFLRDRRIPDGHDWADTANIRKALDWPFEGLFFDVENNELWWPEWGERPSNAGERREVLRKVVSRAPKLIPLFGHRYLPEKPCKSGNPVFSVWQSDIICYGANLEHYLVREFGGGQFSPWPDVIREVPFWSEMVRRA